MDWERFLAIAACPTCALRIRKHGSTLRCASGHEFALDDLGIPVFAPSKRRASASQALCQEEQAAAYAGMRAFAADAIGYGGAEGLYRTAADLLRRACSESDVRSLLDLGCGVGRTLVDAAKLFPQALVLGLDTSEAALALAYAVSQLRGPAITVDLRRWGFDYRTFAGHGLANVFLLQAEASRLPFATGATWPGFDAISCVNLLDRVDDPGAVLESAARFLRPGGSLVLATPLNWRGEDGSTWQQFGGLAALSLAAARCGLNVDAAFDGLIYRELQDRRGSVLDWRVAVIQARRTSDGSHSTLL